MLRVRLYVAFSANGTDGFRSTCPIVKFAAIPSPLTTKNPSMSDTVISGVSVAAPSVSVASDSAAVTTR